MVEDLEGLFVAYIQGSLKLKVEHRDDNATILNLDMSFKEGTLTGKLSDKRDSIPFCIVRMTHIECNIPPPIFF